jgi:hypothetical protein
MYQKTLERCDVIAHDDSRFDQLNVEGGGQSGIARPSAVHRVKAALMHSISLSPYVPTEMSGKTFLDAARSSLVGFVPSEAPQVKSLTDQRGTETHSSYPAAFGRAYSELFRIASPTQSEDSPWTIHQVRP